MRVRASSVRKREIEGEKEGNKQQKYIYRPCIKRVGEEFGGCLKHYLGLCDVPASLNSRYKLDRGESQLQIGLSLLCFASSSRGAYNGDY